MKTLVKGRGLSLLASTALGLVFLLAAFSKIGDLEAFHQALNRVTLLPLWVKGVAVLTLPGLELVLGLCLLARVSLRESALISFGLLLGFLGFSLFAVGTGQSGDCGCFRIKVPDGQEMSGWWMVARNAGFLLLAGCLLWKERATPKAPQIDGTHPGGSVKSSKEASLSLGFGRFLPTLLPLVLLPIWPALGQDSTVSPPSQELSGELQKVLREARGKRKEALKARFQPILDDLSRRTSGSYHSLYLDAVYGVFFSKDPKPERAFQEWEKKNKGLVKDPRLPLATQLAALNLQGQIHLILENEPEAFSSFKELIETLAGAPDDLVGFHLMHESLPETLLVRFYGIEPDYWKEGNRHTGPISEVEALFSIHILPSLVGERTKDLARMWDASIQASARMATSSDAKARKFDLTDHPRLLVAKADSLNQAGLKAEAIQVLKMVLKTFPHYPKFGEVTDRLITIDSGAN